MRLAPYVLAFLTVAGSVAASRDTLRLRGAAAECLRFDETLGYSASGAREHGDARWSVLQLADSGRVARPLFPKRERAQWARGSRWTTRGDSVRIRLSDGLVGWDITLRRAGDDFLGRATYLTDVRSPGWAPPRIDVHASRTGCPASTD